MQNEEYEFHYSKFPKKESDRVLFFAELRIKFEEDIKTNPLYDDFFTEHGISRSRFANRWAFYKSNFLKLGEFLLNDHNISKEVRHQELTEKYYWLIAQKKLFNLQCLWRAGKVHIPSIYCSYHFWFWGENIRECPFLDPITETEIEVMKGFLLENNEDGDNYLDRELQDYRELAERDWDGNYCNYPEWFEYYDGRMGTGVLLQLQDVVGTAEERYLDVIRKKEQKERELALEKERELALEKERELAEQKERELAEQRERKLANSPTQTDKNIPQPAAPKNPPPKKLKMVLHADMKDFIEHFEHGYIQYLYRQFKRASEVPRNDYVGTDTLYLTIEELAKADEVIYSRGGMNWYDEIISCAARYQHTIIAEDISIIHEEYMMLRSLGMINFINQPDYTSGWDYSHFIKVVENRILDGRELLGEPRDFSYLP